MGDYWDRMPEAHFDVDIKKKTHLVAIDEEIAGQITAIAKSKKTSSESLVLSEVIAGSSALLWARSAST